MEYDLPEGFDPDSNDWGQGDIPVSDIAAEYGWSDWGEIIAPIDDYDNDNVRPGIYVTAQDAIRMAYDVGILDFTRIIWESSTGFWKLVVEY